MQLRMGLVMLPSSERNWRLVVAATLAAPLEEGGAGACIVLALAPNCQSDPVPVGIYAGTLGLTATTWCHATCTSLSICAYKGQPQNKPKVSLYHLANISRFPQGSENVSSFTAEETTFLFLEYEDSTGNDYV